MACGRCGSKPSAKTYEYTSKSGAKTAYASESEAAAKVARSGGSYRAV